MLPCWVCGVFGGGEGYEDSRHGTVVGLEGLEVSIVVPARETPVVLARQLCIFEDTNNIQYTVTWHRQWIRNSNEQLHGFVSESETAMNSYMASSVDQKQQ